MDTSSGKCRDWRSQNVTRRLILDMILKQEGEEYNQVEEDGSNAEVDD